MPALLIACRAHVSPYRSPRASLKGGAMKRVLVTGANKGIGLAVVERLLSERSDTVVLLGCRSSERGAAAAATLLAREPSWAARLETLKVDVNDAAQVQSAAADVRARHGEACLYGLVNNAGIAGGTPAEIVDTNLRGVKLVTDAFASLVAPSGRVVNVSSGSAPMFVAECAPERVRFFRDASTTWAALDAAATEYVAACAAGEDALAALGYPRKPNPCARPCAAALANTSRLQKCCPMLTSCSCTDAPTRWFLKGFAERADDAAGCGLAACACERLLARLYCDRPDRAHDEGLWQVPG